MRFSWTIAASAGAWLVACSSESVGPPPQPPVNWQSFAAKAAPDAGPSEPTSRERAIAEGYASALGSPAFAALGPLFEEDVRFGFPGAEDVRGRAAVVRAHQNLFGAFDSRAVTLRRIFRTSAEQTVEWTMTGIQTGDWMGVAATQKPVTLRGVALLFTQDDGAITDVRIDFDVAAVKAELGAGPKGAAPPALGTDAGSPRAPEVIDQTGSPEEAANVTIARAALDALEANNLAAYVAAFADDVELTAMGGAPPWRSKADASAYFGAIHRAVGQLDTTVTDAWGAGSYAVLAYTIAGEQRGALGWVPARDKAIRLHLVDVAQIRAGKIERLWRYDNLTEITAP